MGLFKEVKKPAIRTAVSGSDVSPRRPVYVAKTAPCIHSCPSGTDVRGWLVTLAQHDAYGRTTHQAIEAAWHAILEHNPFPAICGRVCQHPCELNCNRKSKDGAVAVNRLEQFVGDTAIAHGWRVEVSARKPGSERIAVIGAGPAGLAAGYHLARAGHAVTLIDAAPRPGGMMRYAIPRSVIPGDVLDSEIANILGVGIELRAGCAVGRDISVDELKKEFRVVFFAVGLQKSAQLSLQEGGYAEAAVIGEPPAAAPELPRNEVTEAISRVLNTVSVAIAQGRTVALAILAYLEGRAPERINAPTIRADKVKLDWYQAAGRVELSAPVTEAEAVAQAARCMSCGMCMDCETCWMYCSRNCFFKLPKGEHYKIKLDTCNGCGKCVEACPCGYLEMN